MRSKIWMAVLLALVVAALPVHAQLGNGRTGIPLLDNPQEALAGEAESRIAQSMASNKVVGQEFTMPSPVLTLVRGMTVELRSAAADLQQEPTFLALQQKNPEVAFRLQQEREALNLRIGAGLNTGLAAIGVQGVLDAESVRRWSQQRAEERDNPEVNQRTMPEAGTIQRPGLVITWSYTLSGYQIGKEWTFDVFRGVFALAVEVRTSRDGPLVAIGVNKVERLVVLRGASGTEYSMPILPAAIDVNLAVFASQLKAEADKTEAYLNANPGRAPFKLASGMAWITLGRKDGLVGRHDGPELPHGTLIRVSGPGHSFTGDVYVSGERASFLSVDGTTVSDQELLGQNPTAVIVREGQATPPVLQPAPTRLDPAQPVPTRPAPTTVPTIGSSVPEDGGFGTGNVSAGPEPEEELSLAKPGQTVGRLVNLIGASYGTVTVETADDQLPAAPHGLKWLRITTPQATNWRLGMVVLAVRFGTDGKEATRFQAVVVANANGKAIVWMPTAASTAGAGEWVFGTAEPLCLTLSTAVPGTVIAVPTDVKVEGPAPARMRWVNVPRSWFGQLIPVPGLVLVLRREVQGQPALNVKAVVIFTLGEVVRCAYGVPEVKFDTSWKAVVTAPTQTTPAPALSTPVPEPAVPDQSRVDPSTFDSKTAVGRFLIAAAATPYGKMVAAPVPPFRNGAAIRTSMPKGVGMAIVPIPMTERGKVDPGMMVRVARTVNGQRQVIPAVVMAHVEDVARKDTAYVYAWTLGIPPGDGWILELPGVTPAPAQ